MDNQFLRVQVLLWQLQLLLSMRMLLIEVTSCALTQRKPRPLLPGRTTGALVTAEEGITSACCWQQLPFRTRHGQHLGHRQGWGHPGLPAGVDARGTGTVHLGAGAGAGAGCTHVPQAAPTVVLPGCHPHRPEAMGAKERTWQLRACCCRRGASMHTHRG